MKPLTKAEKKQIWEYVVTSSIISLSYICIIIKTWLRDNKGVIMSTDGIPDYVGFKRPLIKRLWRGGSGDNEWWPRGDLKRLKYAKKQLKKYS